MTNPVRLGNELQVNTYTTGDQDQCSIAALSDGGFVVTWMSNGQDGSFEGIYGQCYFADGSANGAEFHISTQTTASQTYPSVASLTGGGFVVTWMSYDQDGSEYGVYAQRYGSTGAPAGSEFRVNTTTANNQSWPCVATLVDGGFVVTWQSGINGGRDIYLQRYDSTGGAVGGETRVVTSGGINPSYDETGPATAGLAGGGYVVTWEAQNADGSGWGIYGRLYDAAGSGGTVFRANTYTSNDQLYPAATGLADGGFVLVWQSYNQDLGGYGIYAQRYTSTGAAAGVEFRVNTTTVGNQMGPSVTALDDGGFMVTWMSDGQDGDGWGVYGQRYAADATASGTEFVINTETAGDQWYPSMAALTNGNVVVTWESEEQDGSGDGVYAQLFSTLQGNAIIFPAAAGYDDWAMLTGSDVEPVTPPDPSDTLVVWPNEDGTVTYIIGTGFTFDEVEGTPTGGTVTTLEHRTSYGGTLLGQITGLSHSLVTGYSYLGRDDADALEDFLAFVLSGDDVIASADPDDTELGGYAGDDAITAGPGSDLIEGGAGADIIDGGANGLVGDTACYFYSPTGVAVNLGAGSASGGDAEGDQLSNIENLIGSAFADTLIGDDGANTISGGAGFDWLEGGDGDDTLDGGAHADNLFGGNGNDTLNGGEGFDRLFDDAGNDTLNGGGAGDVIWGGLGNDTVNGGDGNDTVHGNAGFDTLRGDAGADRLYGDFNRDFLYGGVDGDILNGGEGGDDLYGEDGDDTLLGGNGNDLLIGGDGIDTLVGNAGFDRLNGGAGNDTLTGAFNGDTFIFADGFGIDTITDFEALNAAEDIDLSAVSAIVDYADLVANHMSVVGGQVRITVDASNYIVLSNLSTTADLDPTNFIF